MLRLKILNTALVIMLIVLLSLIIGVAISHHGESGRKDAVRKFKEESARSIRYVEDERTGVCYAVLYGLYSSPSITAVPCEKVEKYLVK